MDRKCTRCPRIVNVSDYPLDEPYVCVPCKNADSEPAAERALFDQESGETWSHTINGFRVWAIRHSAGYWCGYIEIPENMRLRYKPHQGINIAYVPDHVPDRLHCSWTTIQPGHRIEGFDCGHGALGDWYPGQTGGQYRTIDFVVSELRKLADDASLIRLESRHIPANCPCLACRVYLRTSVITHEEWIADHARRILEQGLPPEITEKLDTAADAAVDHPKHYGGADDPYEAIKVMEAFHGPEAVRWFCILSAEKYLSRMGKKPGEPMLRDLKKAAWYLDYAAKMSAKIEAK